MKKLLLIAVLGLVASNVLAKQVGVVYYVPNVDEATVAPVVLGQYADSTCSTSTRLGYSRKISASEFDQPIDIKDGTKYIQAKFYIGSQTSSCVPFNPETEKEIKITMDNGKLEFY